MKHFVVSSGAWRPAGLVGAAIGLVMVACSAPAPSQVVPTVQAAATSVSAVRTQASGAVQSVATPAVATAQAAATPVAVTVQAAATARAAGTPLADTGQGVATSVAATAQVAATPAIATAQAAAAGAAASLPPTVAALVTQAAGTVQPVVATSVAASRVQISQASLSQGDPTVTIRNDGSSAVDIGGWTLALGPFLVVLPGGTDLLVEAGQALTVHLSQGTSGAGDVYVGAPPAPALAAVQRGAPLVLVDPRGQPTSIYRPS